MKLVLLWWAGSIQEPSFQVSLSSHFTENCFSARIRSDLCLQGPVFRSRACAKVEGLYMLGPGMQMAPDPGDGSANEHTAPTGPRSGEFCPASRTGRHQPSCPLGVTQQSLRGTSWYLSSSSRDLVSGIIELQLTTLCPVSLSQPPSATLVWRSRGAAASSAPSSAASVITMWRPRQAAAPACFRRWWRRTVGSRRSVQMLNCRHGVSVPSLMNTLRKTLWQYVYSH